MSIQKIDIEIKNANEAIRISEDLLNQSTPLNESKLLKNEVSKLLHISMDTLRNWELNGLLKTNRKENGYRIYTDDDIRRLKIIRSLRCANYSLSAILRMMNELDKNSKTNIGVVLDCPIESEDVFSACDKLVTSLNYAKTNAFEIIKILEELRSKDRNPTQ